MSNAGLEHYQDYLNHLAENNRQGAGLSLMCSAIAGYVKAQSELGYKYLNGILFPKDHEQAFRWLNAAAGQDDMDAVVNLATMYMYGYGTKTDGVQARALLERAVQAEYAAAGRFMGLCHEKGIGGPKNEAEAVRWYLWGAERDDPGAAYLLADCYKEGRGVPKDPGQAAAWLEKAAQTEGEEADMAREALAEMKGQK